MHNLKFFGIFKMLHALYFIVIIVNYLSKERVFDLFCYFCGDYNSQQIRNPTNKIKAAQIKN